MCYPPHPYIPSTIRYYLKLLPHVYCQPRWLRGLRRSLLHSLMIARHCVLRNWDRILVRAVKGLIYRAVMSRYIRYCDKETLNSNKPNQTTPHVYWWATFFVGSVFYANSTRPDKTLLRKTHKTAVHSLKS